MRNNKPLIVFIFLSAALVFFTVLVGMVLIPESAKLAQLYIGEVDLSVIPDGTYWGSAETVMAAASVTVTVKSQEIADIELTRHIHSNGKKAEAVLDRVIEEQRLGVDLVAGATTSSMGLLKAIENALQDEN